MNIDCAFVLVDGYGCLHVDENPLPSNWFLKSSKPSTTQATVDPHQKKVKDRKK